MSVSGGAARAMTRTLSNQRVWRALSPVPCAKLKSFSPPREKAPYGSKAVRGMATRCHVVVSASTSEMYGARSMSGVLMFAVLSRARRGSADPATETGPFREMIRLSYPVALRLAQPGLATKILQLPPVTDIHSSSPEADPVAACACTMRSLSAEGPPSVRVLGAVRRPNEAS